MKKIKILLLMLIPGLGFAQSTTTTTTTTTTGDNTSVPADDKADKKSDNDCSNAYIGFRFMPTLTNMYIKEQNNGNVKASGVLGYGFGAIIGYNFTKNIGVQGEVLYSALAQEFVIGEKKQRLDLSYINIPLLLSLNTNYCKSVNLNFVVGPQIGINTGSKIKSEGGEGTDTIQAVVAVKPADLGIAYGVGVDFKLGSNMHLGLGFRGVYGLLDISDNNNTATTNEYYVLDRAHVKTYSGYVGLSFDF